MRVACCFYSFLVAPLSVKIFRIAPPDEYEIEEKMFYLVYFMVQKDYFANV